MKMNKAKIMLIRLVILLSALFCVTANAYADYVIDVYKAADGSGSKKTSFVSTGNGTQMKATFTIDNYTGNTNDYKFWVGNGGWNEGKSENVYLSQYIPSCTSGTMTIYIYTDSGDKNYYPHNGTCGEGGGSAAGTVNEPYVIDVYNNDIGYHEKFELTPVAGSKNYEYETTFTIDGYTGNPVDYMFWVGENDAWKNGQSVNQQLSTYVTACETGTFKVKIYALQESGVPHGSKNNYYPEIQCSESPASLTLKSSVREFDLSDPPATITLTATADDKTEGNYIWYFSSDKGTTYKKLGETATNTLELADGKIPAEDRWDFKVARKLVGNDLYKEAFCVIYTIQSCGVNTKGSNIFHEDFGTLATEDARGAKATYDGIVSGYTYQEAPYKVGDGFYAVVANPYYSGCGEGSDNDNKVDATCLARLQWFRDLPDHSLYNDTETGPYGGMLLINFKKAGIAYQRELTTDEAKNIRKNSILTFSAYFASAARERPGLAFNPIKMEMIIQFLKDGKSESEWENVATIKSEVTEREGWQRSQVSWTVKDDEGKFRVVIDNKGAGTGSGNDLLVDDISLDLCTPAFTMHFYDVENDEMTETMLAPAINDTALMRVPKINFGSLGQEVCMQAYQVHIDGTDTTYTYLTDMILDEESGYYVGKAIAKDVFDSIPDLVQITCVASALDAGACNPVIKTEVERGNYKPGKQTEAVFSKNVLTYTLDCGTSTLVNPSDETSVCVIVDKDGKNTASVPALQLTSNNVGDAASVAIFVNNQPLVEGIAYKIDEGKKFMTLDLNKLYADANAGAAYSWTIGANTIKVQVTETLNGKEYCQRWANDPVVIDVKTCGDVELSARIDDDITSFCVGEEFIYSVSVSGEDDLPATIWDIAVMVEWDKEILELSEEQICREFNPETGKWELGVMTANASASVGLKFKVLESEVSSTSIKAYISYIKGKPYASFDAQTETRWKKPLDLTIRQKAVKPVADRYPEKYAYNMCPIMGEVSYNSLLSVPSPSPENPDAMNNLVWLDANKQPAINSSFNSYLPVDTTLYVYNKGNEQLCNSDTVTVNYRVKEQTPTPVVHDSVLCVLGEGAELINLQDLVDVTASLKDFDGKYTAYKYLIFKDETGAEVTTADPTKVGSTTYQITASLDEIESSKTDNCEAYTDVTVTVKDSVYSISLTPEVGKIIVGADDTKKLEVDGSNYTVTWYVNGVESDNPFDRPYVDTEYKVVVAGECNTREASASTTVVWPTVFTPYLQDGLNDNFVKDMQPNLPTAIYNRFGAPVVETQNGWDGKLSNGQMAMPGVYYYVVTLPDGNVKKGTIEIFKK